MKKVITVIVLVLSVSFSYAQKKTAADKAAANTKEMVKVMSLTEEQEAKVYDINLVKNTKLMENDKVEQSKEEKKANQKEIYVAAGTQFKDAVGMDKMKVWWDYMAEKSKK